MSKLPRRGEIWLLDWSPARGSEQAGFRPALVIQTDAANSNPGYPNTIVLAVSTRGKTVPFHIPLTPNRRNGLTEASFVKCEQVLTVAKDRLVRKLGVVGDEELGRINRAVRLVLEVG
ncbi:MAG: type II toxin-antitoxin system PemK/MazF family toxin [Desulfobulbaceae bacterium]|nr:type II toxin-antitoxin system PemK/MazF family toxin [Desulfobulbaceae bacterium]